MTDIWVVMSMLFVIVAMGLFAWLAVERMDYYKTGDHERKTRVLIIAFACILSLLLAAGVQSFKTGIR